ncbi:hypothetical protein FSP39_001524 [Pinctada imbricata]|uniref:Endonuclease/exonuclease/phosphatase domain-containing protein n=1 Tax=Pinctada imbricata TaxID=66713 RepID=A0AA88YDB9_PINIB|nr:hypothetical protein FSP39_001524 [Pinctada imbricata]
MQWGFEHILAQGKNDSRGVLTLFNNNFDFTINRTKKDDKGNLLVTEVKIHNMITVTLINIYGPNNDDETFFEKLSEIIEDFSNEFVIICGDWNLTQDFNKDCYNYVSHNHPKCRAVVDKLKYEHNLVDPWRVNFPQNKEYTWHRTNPIKQARLDFFLISEELMSLVNSVKILPGYRTDHSYIELNLKISDFKKGSGFWRFNNSLLKDLEYVNLVKNCILECKQEYVPSSIIKERIPEIPNNDIPFSIDDNLFLEMLLMKIRSKTLPYCAKKKREKNLEKENLEKEIADLKKILNDNMDEAIATRFSNLNKQLESIRKRELEGLLIRTRSRWIEDGEKPTKYFCGLEKRNFINKTVTRIVKDDSKEITEQSEILKEIRTFYKNLYDNRDDSLDDVNLYQLLSEVEVPKLSDDEKKLLDTPLTKDEILVCGVEVHLIFYVSTYPPGLENGCQFSEFNKTASRASVSSKTSGLFKVSNFIYQMREFFMSTHNPLHSIVLPIAGSSVYSDCGRCYTFLYSVSEDLPSNPFLEFPCLLSIPVEVHDLTPGKENAQMECSERHQKPHLTLKTF